jgi:hypothetical protein
MSKHCLIVSLAAVSLTLAWMGGVAQAQGRGRGFGRMMSPESIRLRLLGIDKVQEALKLTGEQKPELTTITKTYGDEVQALFAGGFQNLTDDERTKKFAEAQAKAKAAWEKCETILTSEQVERVKQISRQARGANALADDDVMLALKLTDDQKNQLETIRDAANQERGALFQQQGLEQDARRAKMAEIQKSADEKSLAVLSDEQKKEFQKLQGEKIELPEGALFGPPPRRPS